MTQGGAARCDTSQHASWVYKKVYQYASRRQPMLLSAARCCTACRSIATKNKLVHSFPMMRAVLSSMSQRQPVLHSASQLPTHPTAPPLYEAMLPALCHLVWTGFKPKPKFKPKPIQTRHKTHLFHCSHYWQLRLRRVEFNQNQLFQFGMKP